MNKVAAEQSLVNILRGSDNCGMGVLALNSRVVTACHCIQDALATASRIVRVSKFMNPNLSVDMMVEWYDENFEIDIAILKPLDSTFHAFEKQLQPAPVQFSLPEPHHEFDVHLYRRAEGWATGRSMLIQQEQQMVEMMSDPVIVVHNSTAAV